MLDAWAAHSKKKRITRNRTAASEPTVVQNVDHALHYPSLCSLDHSVATVPLRLRWTYEESVETVATLLAEVHRLGWKKQRTRHCKGLTLTQAVRQAGRALGLHFTNAAYNKLNNTIAAAHFSAPSSQEILIRARQKLQQHPGLEGATPFQFDHLVTNDSPRPANTNNINNTQ